MAIKEIKLNGQGTGFYSMEFKEDPNIGNKEKVEIEGLRFDKGKIRYDLLEPFAMEQLAKVFTKGAEKYEPYNWLKGMKWSKMRASLGRHLAAYDNCEDFDIDPTCEDCMKGECTNHTGLYHIAQVAWNALGILSYYKHYPQGDDRFRKSSIRIGLDIDDVLADWIGTFCELSKSSMPENWNFGFVTKIKKLIDEGLNYGEVMENLPVKTKPSDIPFEPTCYITSRNHTDVSVAEKWIAKNGFSQVPVIQVSRSEDKLKACQDMKLDVFVDDKYDTFELLNKNGILCYLFDTPWNQRYNVGYKRIKSFKELA